MTPTVKQIAYTSPLGFWQALLVNKAISFVLPDGFFLFCLCGGSYHKEKWKQAVWHCETIRPCFLKYQWFVSAIKSKWKLMQLV